MSHDDRRVHADGGDLEIVRYNRAGKWYIEPRNRALPRQGITIGEAARMAVWLRDHKGGTVRLGLPGGGAFDRLARNFGGES